MKADDWSSLQSREINSCLIHREDPRKHSDWPSVSHASNLRVKYQGVGGRGCLLFLAFPGAQVENLPNFPHRDARSGDNTLANG